MLLVMHNFVGLGDLISKNLTYLEVNFDVLFYEDIPNFRYQNKSEKFIGFFRKIFLNDRRFKKKLRLEHQNKILLSSAQNLGYYETILVINTEYFEHRFIFELSKHTNNLKGFHWDGLNRSSDLYYKVKLFNEFFVFDKNDVNDEENIYFLPNFYFDFPEEYLENETFDLLYIGTFVEERLEKLLKLTNRLKMSGYNCKISLISFDKQVIKHWQNSDIDVSNSLIDYKENLEFAKKTKILLDLKLTIHNGLSFRFFEALKYEKKIITDNEDVRNYDFYESANIFILGIDSFEQLEIFINSPYKSIDENIKNQYSFTNWLETILNKNK